MRKTSLLLVAVAILISGCATQNSQRTVWNKSGATQSDLTKDHNQCDYEADVASPVADRSFQAAVDARILMSKLYKKCMVAKGWTESRQ